MNNEERIAAMLQHPLFQGLDHDTLAKIAKAAQVIKREAGQTFFQERDEMCLLYLLIEGYVHFRIQGHKHLFQMRVIRPYKIFGVRSVVPYMMRQIASQDRSPRMLYDSDAKAVERSIALAWPGERIVQWADSHPFMHSYLTLFVFMRLDMYQDRIIELSNKHTPASRLASNLLYLEGEIGRPYRGRRVIDMGNILFADYIVSDESEVSRAFAYWKREKIIWRGKMKIAILDRERLQAIALDPSWKVPEESPAP